MKKYFNKFLMLAGFVLMAFVAVNMNACSKKGGGSSKPPNPYGSYYPGTGGYPPGAGGISQASGVNGNGLMFLTLTYNGPAAQGILQIMPGIPPMECSLPPGVYNLNTVAPGIYNQQLGAYENIQMTANNGMPVILVMSYIYPDSYTGASRLFAMVQIPGCPTNFQ